MNGEREKPDGYDEDSELDRIANEWRNSTFGGFFNPDGSFGWDRVPPMEWIFQGLVERDQPWYFAGPGGVGKSRFGLALLIALATGKSFGEFVPANPDGIKVIFLTHEETQRGLIHRLGNQYDLWRSKEPWTPVHTERLAKNLFAPSLEFDSFQASITDVTDRSYARVGRHTRPRSVLTPLSLSGTLAHRVRTA